MITVCCRVAHSFKTMARREPVAVQFPLSVPFNNFALVEGLKSMFGTERENLNGDWLASSHGFERVSETTAYSNHIKNS